MWPFNSKKNIPQSEIFNGFTDWHSHILPGVDDGVPTIEESIAILQEYEKLGVKSVWLTPHIMDDVPNKTIALRERFDLLRDAYSGPVKLQLAAENMMDSLFDQRLELMDILPMGKRRDHLLVETSYFTPPLDLYAVLQRVKSKGFFPVLAHPERYIYMDDKDYANLKKQDIKFQLNIYSLLGMYGPEAEYKARKMLKKGYYNAIGTDTHRLRQLEIGLKQKSLSKKDIFNIRRIRGID